MSTNTRGGRGARSPALAAFLSFLWPGLGQWYVGTRRAALVFAVPVAVVAVIVGAWLIEGPESIVISLLSPGTALTVVALIGLMALWRIVSMLDARAAAGGGSWRRLTPSVAFAAMMLAVLVSHAAAGSIAWSFYQASSKIFVDEVDAASTPRPAGSNPVVELPVATPNATPQTSQSRINILLLGIDSNERRAHALTDTLLVVSVDPGTNQVAMISFPRDIARFPLWTGGRYPDKINSLMTHAERNPTKFPDGGLPSLTKELGHLLGVPIHYYAAVNLDGFEAMIDRVGGVTIDNKSPIHDPSYGGWKDGRIGFSLPTGVQTLDGQTALAYVRSRKGAGDNDFNRARRQQELLVALEKKLSDPAMLPNLPGLLDDATRTITTNFPADRLSEMLDIGRAIDDSAINRYVLGPPYSRRPSVSGEYILVLNEERIAKLSVELFGNDSRYAKVSPP